MASMPFIAPFDRINLNNKSVFTYSLPFMFGAYGYLPLVYVRGNRAGSCWPL